MRPPTPITVILVCLTALVSRGADHPARPADGWHDAILLLYNDAHRTFRQGSLEQTDDSREWRLGQALTLLNLQPRTDTNISRSESLLDELVAENAGDEIGIVSRYFLARINQVHRLTPDPEAALQAFRALLDDQPGHLFGQYAGVKWALTYLGTAPTPESRRERLLEIETLIPAITLPGPAKDFHLFLAESAERYSSDPAKSLEHLLTAVNLGISKRNLRGDVYVRIGEIARDLGRTTLALEYHHRFIDEFPRDLRTFTITRTVEEMEASR